MISAGNTTITVSNMDAAIRFYADILGLNLTNRIGNRWATIDAGPSYWTSEEIMAGLVLALQGTSKNRPAPGTKGAVTFGLETYAPLEGIVERLKGSGVHFTSEIIQFEAGNCVGLEDPDGNPFYLQEFPPEMLEEKDRQENPPSRFSGGHALVFVSNMDEAVRFYRDVLGLPLTNRFGDKLATVEAGRKLVLGLHPASNHHPTPGTPGAMILGLDVDEPIDQVVARLAAQGVRVRGAVARSEVELEDPDGNLIVLREDESSGKEVGASLSTADYANQTD